MNTYKAVISYNGKRYSGWQIQPSSITVQGEINNALKKIVGPSLKTLASGRTDAGVHALNQIVKIDINKQMEPEALKNALNAHLPNDILVKDLKKAEGSFHPISHSQWKEYRYYFCVSRRPSPFLEGLVTFYPHQIDVEKMISACQLFLGEHDFKEFQTVGTPTPSTLREMFEISLDRISDKAELPFTGHPIDQIYVLKIRGNGFLKQMVRLVMGSLFSVGRGKLAESDISKFLARQAERHSFAVAPAAGLYLYQVHYQN